MEFYVFDLHFNRYGIIDDFKEVQIQPSYDSLGQLTMTIDGTKEFINLLQVDRILVNTTELSKGYIIKTREYLDENSSELQIIAPSLNVILNDRLVLGQQEFTGTIEEVMKAFVNVNCINPTNPNRIIPNLTLANDRGIDIITTTEGTKNEPLCDYLYTLCKKHDVSFDILLDHENKQFVFDVWQGMDRSTEQDENPPIIFSKEFDNILKLDYTETVSDMKTTAIVLGEETDSGQTIVTVNNNKSGFERKEILVESDVKTTYENESGNEINLTDSEYQKLLEEDGKNTLAEYAAVKTLESEVDPLSNFVYGVDYFMGDRVSIRDDDLGIILHTRIISAVEKESKQGKSVQLNFGNNIPSLIAKIKRTVKK